MKQILIILIKLCYFSNTAMFVIAKEKRDLQNNHNFKDEKNNFFVYLNFHVKDNSSQRGPVDDRVIEQPQLSKLFDIFLAAASAAAAAHSNKPASDTSKVSSSPQPQLSTKPVSTSNVNESFSNYLVLVHNFNTLFRILSFIAFVLVVFSCTSSIFLVFVVLSYRFKRVHSSITSLTHEDAEQKDLTKQPATNEASVTLTLLDNSTTHNHDDVELEDDCDFKENSQRDLSQSCDELKHDRKCDYRRYFKIKK